MSNRFTNCTSLMVSIAPSIVPCSALTVPVMDWPFSFPCLCFTARRSGFSGPLPQPAKYPTARNNQDLHVSADTHGQTSSRTYLHAYCVCAFFFFCLWGLARKKEWLESWHELIDGVMPKKHEQLILLLQQRLL